MYELKAQILRDAGNFDQAVEIYEDVIEKVNNDDRLEKKIRDEFADDIRYMLSGVYVDMKKIDKAADQLKDAVEEKAGQREYNNDLGFIWADNDMNLEESETLIRKAIDLDKKERKKLNPELKDDKDNASYLDSLGWVLYSRRSTRTPCCRYRRRSSRRKGNTWKSTII